MVQTVTFVLDYIKACWVKFEDTEDVTELLTLRSHNLFYDKHDNLVFMAESEYQLNAAKEKANLKGHKDNLVMKETNKTTNNNLFVGNHEELLKLLKDTKQ